MRRLLVIPCPVPDAWAAMPADGDGRFCERCRQRVTDVATLDAERLDELLAAAKRGQVCGRFELAGGRPRLELGFAAGLLVSVLAGCATPLDGADPQPCEPDSTAWIEFLDDDAAVEGVRIAGMVRDSSNDAPIVNAIVIAQSTTLEKQQERITDADGFYKFEGLPPGNYTIQVLAGKANVSKIANLPANAKFRANFRLDPAQEDLIGMVVEPATLSSSPASSYSSKLIEYW